MSSLLLHSADATTVLLSGMTSHARLETCPRTCRPLPARTRDGYHCFQLCTSMHGGNVSDHVEIVNVQNFKIADTEKSHHETTVAQATIPLHGA